MAFHDITVAADPSVVPGALREQITRTLPGRGTIEFEQAPAGYLTKTGERRTKDHRAYYWDPAPAVCEPCGGGGREAGARPGTTRKCGACNGTGDTARRVRLTSVTTLLGQVLPSDGLVPWAEARGIEGAVEAVQRGLLDPSDPASAAMAVDVVRANRLGQDRARDDAADRGLNVHALLESYMLTGNAPRPQDHLPEHQGYLTALVRWLRDVDPAPAAVEEVVACPDDGYGGRYDLVAEVNREMVLYDAKTQARGQIFPKAHLQLGLLRRGLRWCGDGEVDRCRVVSFAADGEYREMDASVDESLVDAALTFARLLKPISSACESANRVQRRARVAA